MEKQVLIPLGILIAVILGIGLFTQKNPNFKIPTRNSVSTPVSSPSPVAGKQLTVGSKTISIEIANTNALRALGLGGRKSMHQENGMLFVFDIKPINVSFWMKDMQMPIDIMWIKNDKVAAIDKAIPAPKAGTPDNQLKLYNPGFPVDYVLEVNSGFSDKNGIKIGDPVVFPDL